MGAMEVEEHVVSAAELQAQGASETGGSAAGAAGSDGKPAFPALSAAEMQVCPWSLLCMCACL